MADANTNGNEEGPDVLELYEQVMKCNALIKEDEVDQIADLVLSKELVIRAWRMAAWLAAKDGIFYQELSTDASKASALVPAIGAMQETAERLRGMAEIMESVSARVAVAGCNHEQFREWSH
ncbi:hypothetical protein [Aquabacterium sp. CECT 9606]|uniref:hypothetical protein n=1 Tax=Aquabacterium sp. CECT 9606 TaxID=2845822 RepID=UPI001E659A68|nr:hypothetical protein [Aquabacterium sp. CECT 9606]CAH0354080.1 hypothetical protein AQB9606_03466 [Aquabacterium sp. CECT 9606]